MFETDGENESEPSSLATASPGRSTQPIERQRSDPCSTPDKFGKPDPAHPLSRSTVFHRLRYSHRIVAAWQRSGAMSADSSPPRMPRTPADHSAPYARYK